MSAPAAQCPCCGGPVAGNTYELAFLQPPRLAVFSVCRLCEAVLRGDDLAAHDALVMAAANRIEGALDAKSVL